MNKTDQMRMSSKAARWRTPADPSVEKVRRNRDLRGKARVQARRREQREAKRVTEGLRELAAKEVE